MHAFSLSPNTAPSVVDLSLLASDFYVAFDNGMYHRFELCGVYISCLRSPLAEKHENQPPAPNLQPQPTVTFCVLSSMLLLLRYQNVWMYVIHEMEDAINDCNNGGERSPGCAEIRACAVGHAFSDNVYSKEQ